MPVLSKRIPDIKRMESNRVRDDIESRNALLMIQIQNNRNVRKAVDIVINGLRNMVDPCFNKLKNGRRFVTQCDETASSILGFVDISYIRLWLRYLPA